MHHLTDRIYDNVRPVNADEMPALIRNYLLAVQRKGQKLSLQFGIFRAVELTGADIRRCIATFPERRENARRT
jgi:hypothetical protein